MSRCPQNAKSHRKGVSYRDFLKLACKWMDFMRNHTLGVALSIFEVNGASRIPLFCWCFLCFCSPGEQGSSISFKTCDFSENHFNIIEIKYFPLNPHTLVKMDALSPPSCKSIGNTSKTNVFLMPR